VMGLFTTGNILCIFLAIGLSGPNGSWAQNGGDEQSSSGIYKFLAFFLTYCSTVSALMTIYLLKWELDRFIVMRRLYKKGIPVIGKATKQERETTTTPKHRRDARASILDPMAGFVAQRRHMTFMIEVDYEVEDEKNSTTRLYRAQFNDEFLHHGIRNGGSVQLLVHPRNHLISRPIGSSKVRSCISSDSSGDTHAACQVAVGSLALITGGFCFVFAWFTRELFVENSNISIAFNEENSLGWMVFLVFSFLAFIPMYPRLKSSFVTEMEFEVAIEV